MLTVLITLFTAQADNLHKKYEWETVPNIEVCPETNISIQEIRNAADYWVETTDFKYNRILKVSSCKTGKENTIQVTDGNDVNKIKEHAKTTVYSWFYENNEDRCFIDYVVVKIPHELKYSSQKDVVLLHEFGHAAGYGHSNHEIMKSIH